MAGSLTELMAGGALAVVILDRVFALIKPLIQKPINGDAAGSQNKNWWIRIAGQLNKDSLIPIAEMLMRIERNQIEILRMLGSVRMDQRRRQDEDSHH